MARRLPRVCSVPGCPELAEAPHFRCPQHESEYHRKQDAQRPNSHRRGYDKDWRRIRARFLRDNPTCAVCGASATVAHHVIRKRDEGPDDYANLVALCAKCHSEHHASTGESFTSRIQ